MVDLTENTKFKRCVSKLFRRIQTKENVDKRSERKRFISFPFKIKS